MTAWLGLDLAHEPGAPRTPDAPGEKLATDLAPVLVDVSDARVAHLDRHLEELDRFRRQPDVPGPVVADAAPDDLPHHLQRRLLTSEDASRLRDALGIRELDDELVWRRRNVEDEKCTLAGPGGSGDEQCRDGGETPHTPMVPTAPRLR